MRRAPLRASSGSGEPEHAFSVARLRELVGQISLKDLVKETTDEVERRCIETALRLTRDNRASAAEMLAAQPPEPLRKAAPAQIIGEDEGDEGPA